MGTKCRDMCRVDSCAVGTGGHETWPRLMSVTDMQQKRLGGEVQPIRCKRNRVAFVPVCSFKECQKLINILQLGVCQGQARSIRRLLCLLSQGNRCSHMKENFISKIAFSILLLLEAFSWRNSHVIIHRGYWKLLKLIHWDIWRLTKGRSCRGLKDINRI